MRADLRLLLKTQSQQGVRSYSNSCQEAEGPCLRGQVSGWSSVKNYNLILDQYLKIQFPNVRLGKTRVMHIYI